MSARPGGTVHDEPPKLAHQTVTFRDGLAFHLAYLLVIDLFLEDAPRILQTSDSGGSVRRHEDTQGDWRIGRYYAGDWVRRR